MGKIYSSPIHLIFNKLEIVEFNLVVSNSENACANNLLPWLTGGAICGEPFSTPTVILSMKGLGRDPELNH